MDRYDQMIEQSRQPSAWLKTAPRAINASISGEAVTIDLDSGVRLTIPWSFVRLGSVVPSRVEILGGGLDLYFPDLDEAIFLPDLLADVARMCQTA